MQILNNSVAATTSGLNIIRGINQKTENNFTLHSETHHCYAMVKPHTKKRRHTTRFKCAPLFLILFTLGLQACSGGSGDTPDTNNTTPITPVNKAPSLQGSSAEYTRTGKLFSFKPDATDANNDTLTFSIENKPTWAQFDTLTGELSGRPNAQDVQQYHDIIITVSDGKSSATLPPFTLKVLHAKIGRSNITIAPDATVTNTAQGYTIAGDATMKVGKLVTEFNNADMAFKYDNDGKLLNVSGEADLPARISDNLTIGTGVRAIIGMYTGAEINASMDIGPNSDPGIELRDEFRYLVYFLNAGTSLTFTNGDGEEEIISLDLAGTRTLIISDPTDPLFYYFGAIAGVEVGFGYSFNDNIPWKPLFDPAGETAFTELKPFLGGAILKGTFPISAFKVFDVLELKGLAVCRRSQLVDCSKPTPVGLVTSLAQALIIDGGIDPSQQIKLGINGSASLKFGILGIDLFEYKLLDVATMIDIGTEREKLAIQGVMEISQSVQPSWLPFKPVPDPGAITVANLFADVDTKTGQGDFGMSLYGEIDSNFPLARMNGSITIDPSGLQMIGFIDDPSNPITVLAKVDADKLDASIQFGYDIQANIDQIVNNALDDAIDDANQAFDDLQTAIGNYDVSLSLDGFRGQIPGIVTTAKNALDTIPGKVYTAVYNGTLSGIRNSCVTIGVKVCADSVLDEVQISKYAAKSARSSAQTKVNARKAKLDNLKAQAQQSKDGPSYRAALKSALLTAVNNATFSQTVKVSKKINFGAKKETFTFYDNNGKALKYTVLNTPTKNKLQTAANNVDKIEPDYSVMINTQQIYDAIPKEQIIEETRTNVANGMTKIPVFKGAGYTMTRGLEQSVYVLLGNERIEINFNPLDPVNAIDNIGSLIAEQILQ